MCINVSGSIIVLAPLHLCGSETFMHFIRIDSEQLTEWSERENIGSWPSRVIENIIMVTGMLLRLITCFKESKIFFLITIVLTLFSMCYCFISLFQHIYIAFRKLLCTYKRCWKWCPWTIVSKSWIKSLHTLPVLHFNLWTTEYIETTAHFNSNFDTDN
jgi:hypothetical protein